MQLHAQHWPPARHARIGNDLLSGQSKKFDRWNKRNIQPPRSERVRQSARQIVGNSGYGRKRLKAVHQRFAIQIINGANSHESASIGDMTGHVPGPLFSGMGFYLLNR
jgi:hypothetical protein